MLVLLLALALAAFAGIGLLGERPAGAPAEPNVLLVSIDSLRADHVGAYGYERDTTPTIDALAREGALFRYAISSSSWTLPAHMTLLTAMPQREHGVARPRSRLRDEAITLAEVMRDAGYRTAAFVSGPTVRASYGFDQGFERYDDRTALRSTSRRAHRGITSPALVELVGAWIGEHAGDRTEEPFFLFLHMWDVHYDFEPPPPYDTLFDPHYRGSVSGAEFEKSPHIHRGMEPRDLEHVIALYDGEIRWTDENLGKILAQLRARGILDETIVVVTSDHGEEFFEHGHKGHAVALYDETVRIPLVIRHPARVGAGSVVDEQVRLMDVAPTILGLAGIPIPKEFGSQASDAAFRPLDLSPWIAAVGRPAAALPALVAVSESDAIVEELVGVRTRRHKLIVRPADPRRSELFDLVADPGERNELLAGGQGLAVARSLEATLAAWRGALAGTTPLAKPAQLDRDQEERLRALGYLR